MSESPELSTNDKAGEAVPVTGTQSGGKDNVQQNIGNMTGGTVIGTIQNIFQQDNPPRATESNRDRLMALVKSRWIIGVLEGNNLKDAVLVDLNYRYDPAAVKPPQYIHRYDQPEQTVSDKNIVDVFQDLGERILILGEPGAGKTTVMLELARELLKLARTDESVPIPVIFNLSSWAQKKQKLEEWLVDVMHDKYSVSRKVAHAWLEAGKIMPMLDGLDEVTNTERDSCASAINSFIAERLTGLVVCSRITENERLKNPLSLEAALRLDLLTPVQIKQYFSGAQHLLTWLQSDAELSEMVRTPLLLHIIVLAYRNLPADELPVLNAETATSTMLFATYINSRFEFEGISDVRREEIWYYLTWLAYQMAHLDISEFHLDDLQPSWLLTENQEYQYYFLLFFVGTLGGVMIGIISGVMISFPFADFLVRFLFVAMTTDYYTILTGDIDFFRTFSDVIKIAFTLIGVLSGVIVFLYYLITSEIKPVDRLEWSWSYALSSGLREAIVGANIGARVGGFIFAVVTIRFQIAWIEAARSQSIWTILNPDNFDNILSFFAPTVLAVTVIGVIIGALIGGLGSVLVGMLIHGIRTSRHIETHQKPNQGIYNSRRHAILGTLLGALFITIISLTLFVQGSTMSFLLFMLLLIELFILVITTIGITMRDGGSAFIQHYLLRFVLIRAGYTPGAYVSFLDEAARLRLLVKVGGSYIFMHRLLRDYLAEKWDGLRHSTE